MEVPPAVPRADAVNMVSEEVDMSAAFKFAIVVAPVAVNVVTPVTSLLPRLSVPEVALIGPKSVSVPLPVPSYVPPVTLREPAASVTLPWLRMPPGIESAALTVVFALTATVPPVDLVRLWKVFALDIVVFEVNSTVLEPAVKVPTFQLGPAIVNVPESAVASSVPGPVTLPPIVCETFASTSDPDVTVQFPFQANAAELFSVAPAALLSESPRIVDPVKLAF
jgi:hypothetical protein